MEFSRQEYWSGWPFLLQGIFQTQGLNPGLLHCRQILHHLSHQGKKDPSVQFSRSVVSDSLWPHGLFVVCQTSLSITNSQGFLKPISIESVMPSNHLILCHPLLHRLHCDIFINKTLYYVFFSSVQSLSHVWLFATPWTAAHQASLSITNSQSVLKLMSIELVMPYNHLIFCHPLLLLPSIFPSIRVFSNESVLCIRWPKYWSFSASASVLSMNIQDWFPLRLTGWISLQSKGLSRVFSNTTIQKHQFFSAQLSLQSNSHIHMWLLTDLCWQSNVSAF